MTSRARASNSPAREPKTAYTVERATPAYVVTLLERLCKAPDAVQDFFAAPLQAKPEAVRLVFWEYHFTTRAEKRDTGAWWRRSQLAETKPITCDR